MNGIKLLYILLASLLAAAACAEDDEGEGDDKGKDTSKQEEGDSATGEDTGTGEDEGEYIEKFTFDDDDEGWGLADGNLGSWEHNADEGTMDGVLEYTEADQTSIVVRPLNGMDLSDAVEIEFRIRVNEDSTPSVGGVNPFIQTTFEDDWTWSSAWTPIPAHNEFATYSLDLEMLGEEDADGRTIDITSVEAIGVQIGSGNNAEEPGTLSVSIDEVTIK